MQKPTYAPDQWVTYERQGVGGFGKIVGGDYDGQDWHYMVKGQLVDDRSVRVKEGEVTLILDNRSWLPPLQQGSTEIYKNIQ